MGHISKGWTWEDLTLSQLPTGNRRDSDEDASDASTAGSGLKVARTCDPTNWPKQKAMETGRMTGRMCRKTQKK